MDNGSNESSHLPSKNHHNAHLFGGVEHALQSRKADQYNPKKDQVDNLQCLELMPKLKVDPT